MRKLGIIGFGGLGSVYAHLIEDEHRTENVRLGAIWDIDPVRRELARKLYPHVPVFDDVDALLASKTCDFVSIAVPHFFHNPLAQKALEAGMPVLLEKPAGIVPQQVRATLALAEKHKDVPFGIMYNQRTNPVFRRIHDLVASGEMGELRQVIWIQRQFRTQRYYDSGSWRATWGGEGGGVLVNQVPHHMDLLQWIFGMPKKVYATTNFGFKRNIAVENDVCAQMVYENGATGVFIACTNDALGEDRLTATFERGRIRCLDSQRLEIEKLYDDEERLGTVYTDEELDELRKSGRLVTKEVFVKDPDPYGLWEHMNVFSAFADHLDDPSKPLVVYGEEGLREVLFAGAIQLSGWTGQSVDIPFDEELYLSELNKRIAEEGKYPLQK